MNENLLSKAIIQASGKPNGYGGLSRVARACGVDYQAVRRWVKNRRFPRTEHMASEIGGTEYADRIAALPGVEISAKELRAWSAEGWKQA